MKTQVDPKKTGDLQRLFWMLGLAITLPMALLSGPLAGYLLSQWLIRRWHMAPQLTLILTLAGLAASALQTVRILKRLYGASKKSS